MPPVISIVGKSGIGKTTYLEKLIAVLVDRGYRVATVKHNRSGFDIDHPGKDTWRMARAGASAIAMSSPNELAVIKKVEREVEMERILELLGDEYDIVLTEGYKRGGAPKVEVFRSGVYDEPVCGPDDNLIAFVSDVELETDVPSFSLEDASPVADLLEKVYLKG